MTTNFKINGMNGEDELHLNNKIPNGENQRNHFGTDQHEYQQNNFGANQDDDLENLMSTMTTRIPLTIIWKGIKPFRITTISYPITIAFLIEV